MRPVRVKKSELLAQITANRTLHRQVFSEAIVGFREQVRKELEDLIVRLEKGKTNYVTISRVAPTDHTKDYDNVIAMITMAVGDEIEVDEAAFNEYVRDDWSWKREFVNTSNAYSATSRSVYKDQAGEEE